MRNAIFSISDAKFGDFLADHWMASLRANADLTNTDVIIFDYGLTESQVDRLRKQDAKIVKCKKDGHVNIVRFRDFDNFLSSHKYGQVMATDGGDVIFQTDITKVFDKDSKAMRAVCEDISFAFEDYFLKGFFSESDAAKIKALLKTRKMINSGVIIGPADKFRKMSKECYSMITDRTRFGPDQVAVNYILYRDGFTELDKGYNFVVQTIDAKFRIRDGIFYFGNGEKIPIIHNAGRYSFFRPVNDFGFGKERNRMKTLHYYLIRYVLQIAVWLRKRFTTH